MEEKPIKRLENLLPNLKGKIHNADYDNIKKIFEQVKGGHYKNQNLMLIADHLDKIKESDELYRYNLKIGELLETAIDIIREL